MTNYLSDVNSRFPVRKSEKQKSAFREYAAKEGERLGWHVRVECLNGRHNNLVFGDPLTAKTVLTAHYDTPGASLIPNLMLPRNPFLSYLYVFSFAFLIAFVALFVATCISLPLDLEYGATMAIYIPLFTLLYFSLMRHGENKHNTNDNTSGVATVLSVMERCAPSEDFAFILFDNEEKGLLGSKAYQKAHAKSLEKTLILNLDCVGDGSNVLFVAKKDAEAMERYKALKEALREENGFSLHFYPTRGSIGNSDYKSFPCGVGIMACRKHPIFGYYTNRIHTRRDTAARQENVDFLAEQLSGYLNT